MVLLQIMLVSIEINIYVLGKIWKEEKILANCY